MCVVESKRSWGNWQSQITRGGVARESREAWRALDGEIQALARRRSQLDHEETRFLRAAEAMRIWRYVGFASMLAYLEDRLGYAPRTALERLRVARALAELPLLEAALQSGTLSYSAVRELSRVARRDTEEAWLQRATGKSLREIEVLVRGRAKGSNPDDDPDPALCTRHVAFEVSPATYALLRQVQKVLADEKGQHVEPDELVATLCRAVLDGQATSDEQDGRARHQVAVTVCGRCMRGWHDAGGQSTELDAVDLEIADCDAQRLGSVDADTPSRAVQDVPPATRRLVMRRDRHRCAVPWCRSARNLDVHHLVARWEGGRHDPSNLCVLCGGCHRALHEGRLTVKGAAPQLVFARAADQPAPAEAVASPPDVAATPVVDLPVPPDPTPVDMQVRSALLELGFRAETARRAVASAIAHVGVDAPIEQLLREALRHCRGATMRS